MWELDIGASVVAGEAVYFRVWAPRAKTVCVRLSSHTHGGEVPLHRDKKGYFEGEAGSVSAGEQYFYVLDDEIVRPDPASRYQPEGVHGPSRIVDPRGFSWADEDWKGIPLKEFIMYELHVGTFTREGTFEAIVEHLNYLTDLGVTAVEMMPVAQFPGSRNWGYDGVYPFAPQNTYGGPEGLKRLINACHRKGLAVVLDVVYNHLGPEGNYLSSFGPYFTDRYKTPWGEAINFDGPYSDQVRHYFISNALYWITEYHVDALRIDAIHGIFDFGARHFLEELAHAVHSLAVALRHPIYVIAESDLNDVRVINPTAIGGYGLDGQWNDDFQHALHALITGETNGYYQDFGGLAHVAKAMSEGFVYSGQYSSYRKRRHGNSSKERPAHQFVIFFQNHDQAGNRPDRVSRILSLEQMKLAASVVLLSPCIPLLFMGEEYAEKAPFYYFVSHSDQTLVEAVRNGRREDFGKFGWASEVPDPQAESTFLTSKIDLCGYRSDEQVHLSDFYRALLHMRKETPVLADPVGEQMEIRDYEDKRVLFVRRWFSGENLSCLYNFNVETIRVTVTLPEGKWVKAVDSSSGKWGGPGELAPLRIVSGGIEDQINLNPYSVVLYRTSEC